MLPACLIQVLLTMHSLVHSHVLSHAMASTFTMADGVQAEASVHSGAVRNRYIIKAYIGIVLLFATYSNVHVLT